MMIHIPAIPAVRQGALAALLSLTIAACSSSEEYKWDMWDYEQQDAMPVSVMNENGTEDYLKAGSSLGIFVIGEDGRATWMTVVVDKDGNIILPQAAQGGRVIAYTPMQPGWGAEAFSTPQLFQVKADQSEQADYDASELMIGTIATITRDTEVELQLRHMMAKAMIHVIDETGSLDGLSTGMRLLGMEGTVSVSLPDMEVTTVEGARLDIDMLPYSFTDRRITMTAITAPQTRLQGEEFFEFTIEGGAHRRCTLTSDAALEGGKTFVYQMRYTEDGLVPDDSYITDWETDGSEADFGIRVKK